MKMRHHQNAIPLPAFSFTDLLSYLQEEATKYLYSRNTNEAKLVEVTVQEINEEHDVDFDDKNEPKTVSVKFTYMDDEHQSAVAGYSGKQSVTVVLKATDSFQVDFEFMVTYRIYEISTIIIGNGEKRDYYEIVRSFLLHLARQRLQSYLQ